MQWKNLFGERQKDFKTSKGQVPKCAPVNIKVNQFEKFKYIFKCKLI